jgi:GNAT superfamily N-acetyltransferase
MMKKIEIAGYARSDHSELLRLLVELHSTYLAQTASAQIQELEQEKDLTRSYEAYLETIENSDGQTWKVFVAKEEKSHLVGFIIGSLDTDEALVFSRIGTLEDWFVENELRGKRVGRMLYEKLEEWFIENGCNQIRSDTWEGNQLSIQAHQRMGFFVSGIQFKKKL